MTEEEKTVRSRAVLNDEILTLAFEETLAKINKDLLSATTPEDREQSWAEYHGLKRAWEKLKRWGATPLKN